MWDYQKGYTITDLTAKQAQKPGFFDGLTTDAAALRSEVLDALSGKGCAFKVTKKKQLVGCMVIRREIMDAAQLTAAEMTLGDAVQEKHDAAREVPLSDSHDKVEVLRMVHRVVLPEHDAAVAAIEQTDEFIGEMKNLMLDDKTKAIFYGDKTVVPTRLSIGGRSASGMAVGMALGLLFGVAMKNIGVGLCFGVAFAASFGTLTRSRGGK